MFAFKDGVVLKSLLIQPTFFFPTLPLLPPHRLSSSTFPSFILILLPFPPSPSHQHLVCHSQHTFFYSQAVLQSLSGSAEVSNSADVKDFLQWLNQEMQKEAQGRSAEISLYATIVNTPFPTTGNMR